jgi:nitrogen fixation/metabolism regulation signal transduction histidine kinase
VSGEQPVGGGARGLRVSLAGRLAAGVAVLLALMVAAAVALEPLVPQWWLRGLLVLLAGLPLALWWVTRVLQPLETTLRSLGDGILSFSDRDFSVRLAVHREDELGRLQQLYNRVADTLQQERREIRQRELLLATALDTSPVAIVLVGPTDNIIYSNREARGLFLGGDSLEGLSMAELLDGCPAAMREILAGDGDGIFAHAAADGRETYSLSRRLFRLNRQPHTLLLLHRITADLDRREVEVWKRVIRVISHELNNSLAPLSSLVYSLSLVTRKPDHREQAEQIFARVRERIDHLESFLSGYARFARLPPPKKVEVSWQELISCLGEFEGLELVGPLPARPGYCDRAQIQQLLVNLLKNAVEASQGEPELGLRIADAGDGGTVLMVMDRGRGMDTEAMKLALLPFHSTKARGSGLGLPLCREIIEAHGGKLAIEARDGGGTIVSCWLPGR